MMFIQSIFNPDKERVSRDGNLLDIFQVKVDNIICDLCFFRGGKSSFSGVFLTLITHSYDRSPLSLPPQILEIQGLYGDNRTEYK